MTTYIISLLVVGTTSTTGMRTNLLSYRYIKLCCSKHCRTELASFVLPKIFHHVLTILSLNNIVT